jgi:ABC-type lipoprotein export system ATPase subunit
MPRVDLVVESAVSCSFRVRQLEGMFDVPQAKTQRVEWHGNVPIDDDDWNVGLIVGPSGSGKSSVARQLFGDHVDVPLQWGSASVIDDFSKDASMEKIADVCRAVGFNTIPAWMRPFSVLSTGEKFRVELARRLLECQDPVVVDEFTSVVDRQVAKIGSHAVQKFLRKNGRRFVAVGCHYDVIDWLQPDWILEPATMTFQRRLVQRRPSVDVEIARVHHSAWSIFAPFHYMTAELNKAAQCFTLFVGDTPATFGAMLHRPHATTKNIVGLSRLVTLPDFQGLGLGLILPERLGAAYKATGRRMRTYPAHPSLIRSFDHSPAWAMVKRPGTHSSKSQGSLVGEMGGRPCAVFEYAGPPDEAAAKGLFDSEECHR